MHIRFFSIFAILLLGLLEARAATTNKVSELSISSGLHTNYSFLANSNVNGATPKSVQLPIATALGALRLLPDWPASLTNNQATSVAFLGDLDVTDEVRADTMQAYTSIFAGLGRFTNSVTSASFIGSGTGTPVLQLFATNNNAVVMGIAISNSVMITNLVGLLHKAYASVVVLDCNHGNRFAFTNRAVTANTTLVLTNLAQGQEINITMLGESAANDRTVTVVPQLGYLVSDLDAFGVAVALNKSFTLTNNNGVEISALATYEIGTNWCNVVTRQYKR
jgi:hypothetical protein